jgi:type VI protein secretion system component VasK
MTYNGNWAWFRLLQNSSIQATRSENLFRVVIKDDTSKSEERLQIDLRTQEGFSDFILGDLFKKITLRKNIFLVSKPSNQNIVDEQTAITGKASIAKDNVNL